jgi:lipoprotein-anchoring transpeptidase ErfK/SrfK
MVDSSYFIRGYAIHGYASVPTYPASHGCVRTPLWFAPGFYARWSIGASVYVFA